MIHLSKAFSKELIIYNYKSKHHIRIEIDTFSFIIDKIFIELTLNQCFFDHTSINLPKKFDLISKISKLHLIMIV